jgi:hypothetical protein
MDLSNLRQFVGSKDGRAGGGLGHFFVFKAALHVVEATLVIRQPIVR